MKKTQVNVDQQNDNVQQAIEVIKLNKELFAEYLRRENNAPGDLLGTSYIFQWVKTLGPQQKQLYQYFVEAVTKRLNENSTKSITREPLEALNNAVDPLNPKEGRFLDTGINQIVEHNNALSETIKGSLRYLTEEDIRPHDYIWRYQKNGRLDNFLHNNPKFVDMLVRNRTHVNALGDSYRQWWLQHKRRPADPLKEDAEKARSLVYAQKSKEALKHYKTVHALFQAFKKQGVDQGFWMDPEEIDNTQIGSDGYLCFNKIENQFPNIRMTLVVPYQGGVQKKEAIITIDENGYHLLNKRMQTYSAVLQNGATILNALKKQVARKQAPPP